MANILFDYDGTLHDSLAIYYPAFCNAYQYLVKKGYAPDKQWTREEVKKWIGYSSKDMWNAFMPDLPESEKQLCSSIIGESMSKLVSEGKACLYKDALYALAALKESGHTLLFLSNCKTAYMEIHRQHFHLEQYFHNFYCTQDYNFAPKYKIFETIKKEYPGTYLIIGDRYPDMEIAFRHHLKSIGCTYGYGTPVELATANQLVHCCGEIPHMVDRLLA